MNLFVRKKPYLSTVDDDIQENFFDELSERPDELSAEAKDSEHIFTPEVNINDLPEQGEPPEPAVLAGDEIASNRIHAKSIHGTRYIQTSEILPVPEETYSSGVAQQEEASLVTARPADVLDLSSARPEPNIDLPFSPHVLDLKS